MWDRAIGNTGPIDHRYTEIARSVLEDLERVVVDGNIVEHEVLNNFGRKLDMCKKEGAVVTQNWTRNYDVVLHRYEKIVMLKIKVVKEPDHKVQGVRDTEMRGITMMLFVLLHGNANGVSED